MDKHKIILPLPVPLETSRVLFFLIHSISDVCSHLNSMQDKNHIMDVWQGKTSNFSLQANYEGQTGEQKKHMIGALHKSMKTNA